MDFDGTNDQVYWKQVVGFSHEYSHHKYFSPSYLFCSNHSLVTYLRPGNVTDSKHSQAILKFLVKKLRKHLHDVQFTFRADVAFCRHKMFNWCKRNNINYITEFPANNSLMKYAQQNIKRIHNLFNKTKEHKGFLVNFNILLKLGEKTKNNS